jgi:hypothetical protein
MGRVNPLRNVARRASLIFTAELDYAMRIDCAHLWDRTDGGRHFSEYSGSLEDLIVVTVQRIAAADAFPGGPHYVGSDGAAIFALAS